jgi:uncharacterized protein
MSSKLDRRSFLRSAGGAVAAAFLGLRQAELLASPASAPGFGPLRPDPDGILDLPDGFNYRILALAGTKMSDGFLVPGLADGMAAFAAPGGRVALVCNHEPYWQRADFGHAFGADYALLDRLPAGRLYDRGREHPSIGGTTTLLYDPARGRVERHVLSLVGTERNCAGGPTPWNSWLSCEESVERAGDSRARDHGWVFEVPASARAPVDPQPLRAMGRFMHEAAAVDPRSGMVYLSEDQPDGLLYRYIPNVRGKLARGGRLQALSLRDFDAADTRNWQRDAVTLRAGDTLAAHWIDLDGVDAADDDLRRRGHARGAALFARGEGLWFGNGALYFACTSGGPARLGQIFRYVPAADDGQLSLFVESGDRRILANADNLTVAPWGDLIVCEDTSNHCGLVGVTPDGALYRFASNPYNTAELAGACFAPDGRTLFVNIQQAGLTLAIKGPFPHA